MNGYTFQLSGGKIYLVKRIGGSFPALCNTDAGYIKINTYYGIKITRDYTGLFTLYFKTTGEYELIGSGTDTAFTESNFSIVYFGDIGDSIRNIKHTKGITQ